MGDNSNGCCSVCPPSPMGVTFPLFARDSSSSSSLSLRWAYTPAVATVLCTSRDPDRRRSPSSSRRPASRDCRGECCSDTSVSACRTTRTVNKPRTSGREVPKERSNRKLDVSPGKRACAMEEKKNADRPKPAATRLVVVARYPLLSVPPHPADFI